MAQIKEVRYIPIDRCVPSAEQVRTREVDKDLDELVDNIRVHGQLEPIIIAPLEHDERYEIIAGQRRWLAMRELGEPTIHAAILDQHVDELTARVLSISENLVRRDLNPKDLIDACTELHRRYGSMKAVAQELGLPYNRVRSYVKYDRLRPRLKELVRAGRIDVKTAIRIEDHYGDDDVDAAEIDATAETVAGMTTAQQCDYFHAARNGQADSAAGVSDRTLRPGAVHQILVTIRKEEYARLREWAASKGLTQDRAAAWIIHGFFRNADRSVGLADHATVRSARRASATA